MKKNNQSIDRKEFLKKAGNIGIAAASAALLFGCDPRKKKSSDRHNIGTDDISTGQMTYRINHTTGDNVSLLGYGFMRLPMQPGNDKKEEKIDQDAVNELVDYAIAHGVNYFDTSPRYVKGMSEHSMGIALSRHPRKKYFVATKMSTFIPDPVLRTREGSIAMYRNSMKELQVDYIDYYLLHGVGLGGLKDFDDRFIKNGVLDFLLKERDAGRIRNLGWSFHGDQAVFDHLLSMGIKWDFAQVQINYSDWHHASGWNINAEYLYEQLTKHKIQVVVMEPLLGGRLARLNYYATAMLKQLQPEASTASWAFRFAGSLPNVLTVLSGMTYKEHLEDNLRTYSPLHLLTDKEKAMFEELMQLVLKYPVVPCTECNYCMPCPYGLNIPGVFAHYNRCVNEGNVPVNTQDKSYRKARRAFLIGYDRRVPKLRQANHCIGCNQCVKACPQKINIPKEMDRIDIFVEKLKKGGGD